MDMQLYIAVFEMQKSALPTNGVADTCFLSVGTQDDTDGDGLSDAYERMVSMTDHLRADTDGDGLPDGWETENGLDPNCRPDAYSDPDGDGIPNLYEYHNGTQPQVADDLSKCVYMNYADPDMGTKLAANTNCWAHGIDFTCASPWNARDKALRAGTAISPRHVLFARHFELRSGEIYFRMRDGAIITNAIVAIKKHANSSIDIGVGLLANDLPAGVSPAKILPQNYYSYIKNGHALPTLSFDQQEHALVHDVNHISSGVDGMSPAGARLEFCEEIVLYDSGNPRFFVIGDEVIILCTFHYGGGGSGPSVIYYKNDVQQLMDELSTAAGLDASCYRLEEFDFGGYVPCEY